MAESKTIVKSIGHTSKKETPKVPAGATEISRECTVEVKEIENGFIISKRTEIKYQNKNQSYHDYLHYTKEWYSETNPIEVKTNTKDKALADIFQD